MVEQLGHQSCDVHSPAYELLAQFGGASVPALTRALEHKDRYVRGGAANVLGNIRSVEAVEPLIAVIDDEDTYVLSCVCRALKSIRDSRAIEPLLLLVDRDPQSMSVQDTHAVGKISPERLKCIALDALVWLGHVPSVIRLMDEAPGVYNLTGLYGSLQHRAEQGEAAAKEMLAICEDYTPRKFHQPYNTLNLE